MNFVIENIENFVDEWNLIIFLYEKNQHKKNIYKKYIEKKRRKKKFIFKLVSKERVWVRRKIKKLFFIHTRMKCEKWENIIYEKKIQKLEKRVKIPLLCFNNNNA